MAWTINVEGIFDASNRNHVSYIASVTVQVKSQRSYLSSVYVSKKDHISYTSSVWVS